MNWYFLSSLFSLTCSLHKLILSGIWAGRGQPLLMIAGVAPQRQSGPLDTARATWSRHRPSPNPQLSYSSPPQQGCWCWEGKERALTGTRASGGQASRLLRQQRGTCSCPCRAGTVADQWDLTLATPPAPSPTTARVPAHPDERVTCVHVESNSPTKASGPTHCVRRLPQGHPFRTPTGNTCTESHLGRESRAKWEGRGMCLNSESKRKPRGGAGGGHSKETEENSFPIKNPKHG